MRLHLAQVFITLAVLFLFGSSSASAVVCNVPSGSHPTIQQAVDDLACTEVVIAAGPYVESVAIGRSLVLTGDSSATTVVEGRVTATGAGVVVALNGMTVDAGAASAAGCYSAAVDVDGGATVNGNDLVAINGDGDACLIFGDGFEAGNADAWDNVVR